MILAIGGDLPKKWRAHRETRDRVGSLISAVPGGAVELPEAAPAFPTLVYGFQMLARKTLDCGHSRFPLVSANPAGIILRQI